MNRASRAFAIVMSGPSGVGKTTLERRLIEADPFVVSSISTTTRRPREGEKTGKDYYFVERDVFEHMKDRELVEWAEVHGEFYGTPRRFIDNEISEGRDVLLNIDVQGGIRVKKVFPDAVMIFILPPSFESLEKRIRQRGDDEKIDIETRLKNAVEEITVSDQYDYHIVNDDLDVAVAQIRAVVEAERCRRDRLDPSFIDSLKK
ncbi:MAG: guanylate kinase [Candidatus Latescibacterota bacterium]